MRTHNKMGFVLNEYPRPGSLLGLKLGIVSCNPSKGFTAANNK